MNCLPAASGGGIAIVRHLAPLLVERFNKTQGQHALKVLVHEQQSDIVSAVKDAHCIWVTSSKLSGWQRLLWEVRNIRRIASEQQIDGLFTPYQIGPRVSGKKHVVMLTNMEPFLFATYPYGLAGWVRNGLLQRASIHSMRRAERVIAVSKFTAALLTDRLGIPPDRIRTIYHGRDVDLAKASVAERELLLLKSQGVTEPFILTSGSLLPYRRCEDVIDAFGRCASALPLVTQLVIAGTGADPRYRAHLDRVILASPLRDRIIAVGHVPMPVMKALYRRCRSIVLATEIEACPNIAIEAMTAGCVIVACDKPPLPEIFAGAALVYPARDIARLSEAIVRSISDDALRLRYQERALARARDFSWEICADQTFAALTQWP